jgi:hypothetical protein
MKAKAVIRDVGRALDIPLGEVDGVAKLIPNIPGKPLPLPKQAATMAGSQVYLVGRSHVGRQRLPAPCGSGDQHIFSQSDLRPGLLLDVRRLADSL